MLIYAENSWQVAPYKLADLADPDIFLSMTSMSQIDPSIWVEKQVASVCNFSKVLVPFASQLSLVLEYLDWSYLQQVSIKSEIRCVPILRVCQHWVHQEICEDSRSLEAEEQGTFPVIKCVPKEFKIHSVVPSW